MERLDGEKFMTVRAAKDVVMNWILWYNRKRLHSTIGYRSPVAYERAWLLQRASSLEAGCGTMEIATRFPHSHNLDCDGIIPSTPAHMGYAF